MTVNFVCNRLKAVLMIGEGRYDRRRAQDVFLAEGTVYGRGAGIKVAKRQLVCFRYSRALNQCC